MGLFGVTNRKGKVICWVDTNVLIGFEPCKTTNKSFWLIYTFDCKKRFKKLMRNASIKSNYRKLYIMIRTPFATYK